MKIKYAIGLNWSNLARHKYPFEEGMNLIVGENGSGKSTLLDLMQTVLTADLRGVVNYNAGQGDDNTKKKTKEYRTFASYLLGGDQGRFSRSECSGAIAIVFEDGAGRPATAWMYGTAALLGTRENRTPSGGIEIMSVMRDCALEPEDFLSETPDGKRELLPKERLLKGLTKKYGKVPTFTGKEDYLANLYGAFLGKNNVGREDAKKAAKALVRYIHPTQADDIHRFVKEELLERKDLDKTVTQLREIMRTYNRIRMDARATKESIDTLAGVLKKGKNAVESWERYYADSYLVHSRKHFRLLASIENHVKQRDHYRRQAESIEADAVARKTRIASLGEEIEQLLQQSASSDVMAQKRQLEAEQNLTGKELAYATSGLQKGFASYRDASSILKMAKSTVGESLPEVDALQQRLSELVGASAEQDPETAVELEGLKGAIEQLLGEEGRLRRWIDTLENDARDRRAAVEKRLRELRNERASFEASGRALYPNQEEINAINSAYPKANARPVCEFIEILDDSWQQAIEGYLGGARFSLIVEPEYEAAVSDFILERKGRSKVVQGALLLRDMQRLTKELPADSIVGIMRFSHPVAEAYMVRNYATVTMVGDIEALRFSHRGILQKGLGSSGYTIYHCLEEKRTCVIGERMKAERKELLNQDLAAVEEEYIGLVSSVGSYSGLLRQIESLELRSISEPMADQKRLNAQLEGILSRLAALDLSDQKELDDRIEVLRKARVTLEKEQEKLITERTNAHNFANTHEEDRIKAEQERQVELSIIEAAAETVRNALLHAGHSTVHADQSVEALNAEAKRSFKDMTAQPSFADLVKEPYLSYREALHDHNRDAIQSAVAPELPDSASDSVESYREVRMVYDAHTQLLETLNNSVLAKKHERLDEQRGEFENTFKEEFCNRIYANIQSGQRELKKINRMLKRHRFGDESFIIKFPLSTELRAFYDYFEYLSKSPRSGLFQEGEGMASNPEEADHAEAKQELERLLLGENESDGARMLQRISDYRNYCDYDIHKVLNGDEEHSVSLDKLATDSGGQAETSYYIIRSLAAYMAFERDIDNVDAPGIAFLLIDEGFMRIDDRRPEKIIGFLLKDLGFQIITAMPPQNEGVFAGLVSGRYEMFKEEIDTRAESFDVRIHSQYSRHNAEAIKALQAADRQRIAERVARQGELVFDA